MDLFRQLKNRGVAFLQHQMRESWLHSPEGMWFHANYTEPTVQLPLRDFCRPGDVVFDVGANFGSLSVLMSRLVGPRGVVCAFEASSRNLSQCQQTLVRNGCGNTQIYHAAIHTQSNDWLPIYFGDHQGSDSLFPSSQSASPVEYVQTIAIDDFVAETSLVPSLIKMDIEGAEFAALQGAIQTLTKHQPVLILETFPTDIRALQFCATQGYSILDLATYREIRTSEDFPPGIAVSNVLCIPPNRQTPYRSTIAKHNVALLTAADFVRTEKNWNSKTPLVLKPGRYQFQVEFRGDRTDNEVYIGIKNEGKFLFRYHGNTSWLAKSYRDWVLDIPRESSLIICCDFLNDTYDPTFSFRGASVALLEGFTGISRL